MLLLFFIPLSLFAHPHIMLSTSMEIEYSNSSCTGIWVEWEFDRFFSVSIINDYDTNKDGEFDNTEVKAIEENAFSNLRNYGYFVDIRVGDKRTKPDSVTQFSAKFSGDKLYYRFFVPLVKDTYNNFYISIFDPTYYSANNFYISIFDPTYYSAVSYVDDGIKIGSGTGLHPQYEVLENKDYPVYYDPYGSASDMATYTKWKPGLQTAYPKEVHVYFP